MYATFDEIMDSLSTGQMDEQLLSDLENNMDEIIDNQMQIIQECIDHEEPEQGYFHLMIANMMINTVCLQKPSLRAKLAKHIHKFRSTLSTLAHNLQADSYSISSSIPPGITLQINWKA